MKNTKRGGVINWIKNHVRPTFRIDNPDKVNWEQAEFGDLLKDVKKNSSVGIKITFKF